MHEEKVILVEDDPAVNRSTSQALRLGGFEVQSFLNAEDALAALHAGVAGVVVADVNLPGMDGLAFLAEARRIDHEIPVTLVTGHGDISMAIHAIKQGAYDFIEKPFASDRLLDVVRRASEKRGLVLENRRLRAALQAQGSSAMLGESAEFEKVRRQVASLGPVDVDVLIHGETGTGKEVVARALHEASGRKGPFVALNCGALPESVFESEIFGHEAGSFTGATRRRIGKIEHAHQGTLFLDEIESLPLNLQVKFLRVLQERTVERLGANESVAAAFRVIAATKESLQALSEQGKFRSDLYYRLNVVRIDLPPLRERQSDISLLLAHFVERSCAKFNRPRPAWTAEQIRDWSGRSWPGNIRELKNFAERLVLGIADDAGHGEGPTDSPPPPAPTQAPPRPASVQAAQGSSTPDTAPMPPPPEPCEAGVPPAPLQAQVAAYERALIEAELARHFGNVAKTADALALPRKTLYDKLRKFELSDAGRSA